VSEQAWKPAKEGDTFPDHVLDRFLRTAAAVKRHHAEQGAYGGAYRDFHAWAETLLGSTLPDLVAEVKRLHDALTWQAACTKAALESQDRLAAEVLALKAQADPTRGALINEAASLGAAAVKAQEAMERLPSGAKRMEAGMVAYAAKKKADEAWAKVRAAVEGGVS
jgi:hypothetical protein